MFRIDLEWKTKESWLTRTISTSRSSVSKIKHNPEAIDELTDQNSATNTER